MDEKQLADALNHLGVNPPDALRSVLYLDFLREVRTYLTETLAEPEGLGDSYAFVEEALCSANLLNELAQSLDSYAGAAVAAYLEQHKTPNYDDFFRDTFLGGHSQSRLGQFWKSYPATESALRKLTDNFKANLCKACERITADQTDITKMFRSIYPDLALEKLTRIESTGSDFHKGGQQVLILTFASTYLREQNLWKGNFKLVYKPSDLEADCLLTGNSYAVNGIMPGFMTASLVEIFNELVEVEKEQNPNSPLEMLRTYLILPRNCTSGYAVGTEPLPLRFAYGYLEFLGYNDYLLPPYLVFGPLLTLISQERTLAIQRFYRMLGQWVALASTFSITDMHIENVRVNNYKPVLIDLEVSLTAAITHVTQTEFFGDVGGITADSHQGTEYVWQVAVNKRTGQAELRNSAFERTYANRLWVPQPKLRMVPVQAEPLLDGFRHAMDLLGKGANRFDPWFIRLSNVLVRYVPFPTGKFLEIRNVLFLAPDREPEAELRERLLEAITEAWNAYRGEPTPSPNFIVLQPGVVLDDFLNLDIPVFYHRIGSTHIVDSRGQKLSIPSEITIAPEKKGDPLVTESLCLGTTFFRDVPTTVNVQQRQLRDIANPDTRLERTKALEEQILAALGHNAAPEGPGVLIPVDVPDAD